MANGLMNISKGGWAELANRVNSNDPANSAFVIVLLKASEADATLEDYDDLGTLIGAAGNTEADFTNYARIVIDDTGSLTVTVDDSGNTRSIDMPDQVWTSAGGTTDNTLTKLLLCYDSDTTSGVDSNIVPIGHWDFAATTNGNNLTAIINASGLITAS